MTARTAAPASDADVTAAREIADELAATAVRSRGLCAWHGAESDLEPGRPVRHVSFGGDLYSGSAGVARFLAVVAAETGSDGLAETARGAIEHAFVRTSGPSLFAGAAGAACTAMELASSLDEPALGERGRALLAQAASAAEHDPAVVDDLISGRAGVLLAVCAAAQAGAPGSWLARARALGDRLTAAAEHDRLGGVSWPLHPGGPHLCGLGHGASGVALALQALARLDPHGRWAGTAAAARRWERAWYSPEHGSWADLRGEQRGYPHLWCHGAVGVAAERLAAVRTGASDELAAADLAGALAGSRAAARGLIDLPAGPAAGDHLNASQCHGLGGMADLFVDVALADPAHGAPWLHLARQCAAQVRRDARRPEGWRTGVLGGGARTPGLMLGLAGIGWALLRVARPGTVPSAWQPGTLLLQPRAVPSVPPVRAEQGCAGGCLGKNGAVVGGGRLWSGDRSAQPVGPTGQPS